MPRRKQLPKDMPYTERLLQRREIGPGGCWLWTGFVHPVEGYGMANWRHAPESQVHRLAWHLWRGPVPEGLCVLHSCDVRRCFNPAHLFLGTRRENNADRDRKHRHRRPLAPVGVVDGHSGLTVEQIRAIRGDPRPQAIIAAEYGMTQQNVSRIKLRQIHGQV